MKNTFKAHAALLGANIIYGANFIIAKGIMPDKIGPSAFVFIRLICCTLIFWVIKSFTTKEKIDRTDFPRLLLCGLLGAAANMLFFFHGINLTSPIDASIIMTATPVIVLFFSYIILKENITKHKILGITIGGIGAAVLILYGNTSAGTSSFLGNLFVFLNASFYGLYLVIVKTLMKKYNATTVVSWFFLFGFIMVIPFSITDFLSTNFEAFTLNTYLVIGYVVFFTTCLTYIFNIYALQYLLPSTTSSYIYLQPVISFIIVCVLAYVLQNSKYAQDIDWIKIVCCLVVVFGVYIASKRQKQTI